MVKIYSTSYFRNNMGEVTRKLHDEKDYVIVANEKIPGKSFVITNINVFSALLKAGNFVNDSSKVKSALDEIQEKVSTRFRAMVDSRKVKK